MPRQFLCVHADKLRIAPEDFSAGYPAPALPRQLLRVHAEGLRLASEDEMADVYPVPPICGPGINAVVPGPVVAMVPLAT
jgi:hypothetical protein